MIVLSFIAMYVLMYGMANAYANVYMNVNQLYMAGLMAAPMGVIELALMRGMYPNRRLNAIVVVGSLVALAAFGPAPAAGSRDGSTVPAIDDSAPRRRDSDVRRGTADIKKLCEGIVASQQSEIDQMKAKLSALDR
jgi:hypothetical protein